MNKHKKNFRFLAGFIALIGALLFFRSISSTPSSDLGEVDNYKPDQVQSSDESETAAPQANETQDNTNPPDTVKINKHPSEILSQNPTAPEYEYYLMATTNDPQLSSSWHLNTLQTDLAWDLTTGSADTVVAVIDSPFALVHEDLSDKWFVNNEETGNTQNGDTCWDGSPKDKTTNNCDDDGNGYKDDWRGYDFKNNDNNVQAGLTNPTGESVSHGTLVAGTVAATANNSKGSVGVDQNAKIMPLQVFDDDGNATTTDIVAAVEYATNNGANVINMSLGSNGNDPLLRSAIQNAVAGNVTVVTSAGNCALNDEPICYSLSAPGRMTYPALFPETIAVGATTSADVRASFSSYGPELDVVGPGSNVGPIPYYSQGNPTTSYAYASGTSFSSPIVAGIASLLLAQNSNLSPAEIRNIVSGSADKVSSMGNFTYLASYGYGRVNAHRATLLALADSEASTELGENSISPNQPSSGHIWRATSGALQTNESLLIGCRVFAGDTCSLTAQTSSSISRFYQNNPSKGKEIQYIFIRGSDLPAGSWLLSVHNNDYASSVDSVTR